MSIDRAQQNNSTLDRMSARLGYAGAGVQSPILEGLKGKFTFTPDHENGETFGIDPFTDNAIRCYEQDMFWTTSRSWSDAISLYDGTKIECEVEFGDSDFTFAGSEPTRNIIEWTTNWGTCRRQFWIAPIQSEGAVYIDNQNAHGSGNSARVFCDPTADINGGDGHASGEDSDTMYWDKNLTFSINLLPEIGDEFFHQQEWFDPTFDVVSGNRYANTLRNWGGVKTVEVWLDDVSDPEGPIISEMPIEDLDGYKWERGNGAQSGTLAEADLKSYTLYFQLRSVAGSSSFVQIMATVSIDRFPCA